MKNDFPTLTTLDGKAIVLRSLKAKGQLEGLLLSMTLHQVFRNDTKANIEVSYSFPLAWGAVLLGLTASIGGKRAVGQVISAQKARDYFEDAIENGDAPILVEKTQQGIFSASLGSLQPGGACQGSCRLSHAALS